MNSSRKNPDHSINIVSKIKPFKQVKSIENVNYMYLKEHHIIRHTSWFKGSRDIEIEALSLISLHKKD